MTIESSKIDEMIREIRSDHSLDNVRFVKAFNGKKRENPIAGLLVTVGIGRSEVSSFFGGFAGNCKADNIKSELVLNVYCPYVDGGDGITETINTILEKIKGTEINESVCDMQVSEIKFSKEYEAVYRTVTLSLDYCA